MRGLCCLLILAVGLAGCVTPQDELIRDYNADGIHLFERGQYAAAQESFQAALALKPGDLGLLYNVGECQDRLGDTLRAEQSYNVCLQRDPNHVPTRFALARLLVRTGRPAEAGQFVQDWLAREPAKADAYALDAWLAHQAGDLPYAQARLQQALELDPHNLRALSELGLIYESLQRADRAVVLYERALAQNPNQPEVRRRLDTLTSQGVRRPRPE